MKQKILLLHGWGGSDFPHWQSWLAGEIAKDYGIVSFFKFDSPEFPIKKEWKDQLKKHLKDFNPDIVICHSLANLLWFHMCNEEKMIKIKKLFLVAVPSLKNEIAEVKTFFPIKVPKNLYAENTILIASTDDPYMSLQEAKELQLLLDIPIKVLQDAKHINAQSGYGEWDWILQQLRN